MHAFNVTILPVIHMAGDVHRDGETANGGYNAHLSTVVLEHLSISKRHRILIKLCTIGINPLFHQRKLTLSTQNITAIREVRE